ncbi:MAG: hypothetical protein O4751_05870 [Trichodesmium sp. St2_bin6]|nr:hypothetical protein [Trichodesmium sp. St2_bin6]
MSIKIGKEGVGLRWRRMVAAAISQTHPLSYEELSLSDSKNPYFQAHFNPINPSSRVLLSCL